MEEEERKHEGKKGRQEKLPRRGESALIGVPGALRSLLYYVSII
jgi:hypothetical protein